MDSFKKLTTMGLGKTGENARRIAATIVLQKAILALTGLFGEDISENMIPTAFRNGRLTIKVSHGVWSQEISLRKEEVIEVINRELGDSLVKDLVTR